MNRVVALAALLLPVLVWAGPACAKTAREPKPNMLSAAEKKAGWVLLFDGKTTKGWRGFNKETFPEKGWAAEAGTLRRVPGDHKPGDIITVDQYDNFELTFDWKISTAGNSGVKYLVDESLVKKGDGALGFEFQVLDDAGHPDAKLGIAGNRTAGGLYDLIAPKDKVVNPPGSWNAARLIVDGNHIQHWLNGRKVVEFERGSPALKALIAGSKFKTKPAFGESAKGHIVLQDHQDEVAFRNIKLRRIAK